ncbi:MAG: hypothetical protein Q9190_000130 [Brigantiaea leucoxantha]
MVNHVHALLIPASLIQSDMQSSPIFASFWPQFLRNVGLGVVNGLSAWLRGRGHRREQKKIAISTSRWTALSRCGVHIFPTLVSAIIIAVNFRQVYIGIDFRKGAGSETVNIALLQTAAKLQELLIIASLATVIFQLLRDELIYGDGIPLGLLGAGFDFAKLSFFWSSEIFGSLKGLFRGSRKYRKVQLLLFLILAGALALLAGPSCAVLLVPQTQDWPAGGTVFFLNGTKDDFWPVSLDYRPSPATSLCSSSNGTKYAICPSGGFYSLWSHYAKVDHSNYKNLVPSYAKDLSGNRYYWTSENLPPLTTRTISLGSADGNAFFVQPHLSVAVLLDQLMHDWWTTLLLKYKLNERNVDDRRAASSKVYSPFVNVQCAPATMLSSSNRTVQFPTINSINQYVHQDLESSNLTDQPADHLKFSWVLLPGTFESVSTGAVLQLPWDSKQEARLVVGCSVQAQWVPAQIETDAYNFWQGWYPKNITFVEAYPSKGSPLFNGTPSSGRSSIVVEKSWLDALSPPTPTEGPGYFDWGPSTIESVLSTTGLVNGLASNSSSSVDLWESGDDNDRAGLLASVIGSVFADGLSRVNIEKMYNIHGNPSEWTLADYGKEDGYNDRLIHGGHALRSPDIAQQDLSKLNVEFAIGGLSYRLTLVQKLALVVLFLHMTIAVLHTFWIVARGKSSACWDSITEILLLAQNSQPAFRALGNTAAGVKHSSTFGKIVTIKPTRKPGSSELDHLELLCEDEEGLTENELSSIVRQSHPQSQPTGSVESTNQALSSVLNYSIQPTCHCRHSDIQTMHSLDDFPLEQISMPSTPLLGSSTNAAQTPSALQIQENYTYG